MSPESDNLNVYLKPGEVHFATKPTTVTTVLGSCLSVTMYHQPSSTGSICHAVFPSSTNLRTDRCARVSPHEFVDTAILWMLEQFARRGIRKTDLEIKMFGAASMFANPDKPGVIAVGENNIKSAVNTFNEQELFLKAWNVGGHAGRKIIFQTHTGEVFQKFLVRNQE